MTLSLLVEKIEEICGDVAESVGYPSLKNE